MRESATSLHFESRRALVDPELRNTVAPAEFRRQHAQSITHL
jgi:hypothetical protein